MSEASEQQTADDPATNEPTTADRGASAADPQEAQRASASDSGGRFGSFRRRFDDTTLLAVLGGLGVFIGAIALYTRFPFSGGLGRDESIYAYEAQQFSRGHAPYASIFDPKTPGSGILGGIAAFVAHLFHANDLHAIRLMFLLLSVLTAVAIYLLTLQVFKSVPGAFAAGATFLCFTKFAHDAIIGPDAKTPGVLFFVLCMLFLARKQWFVGAIFAGLAFNCWQPLFWFGLIAIIAAIVHAGSGNRLRQGVRTFVGAALPSVVLTLYFLIAGAIKPYLSATLLYPLLGTVRAKESLSNHLVHPFNVLAHFPMTATLWWTGVLALFGVVVVEFVKNGRATLTSPVFLIVLMTFVGNMFYAFTDFQSDPDTLPLLPYASIGIGGLVALVFSGLGRPVLRRVAAAVVVVAVLALWSVSWVSYTDKWGNDHKLLTQLRAACGIDRLAGPGVDQLVSLGNPEVFVLTHRRSRTNYIYLSSGVDKWKIRHTKRRLEGWEHQIIARHPSVINVDGWQTAYTDIVTRYLQANGYTQRYIGLYRVFVSKAALARAKQVNVKLTKQRHRYARAADGTRLPAKVPCGNG